MSKKRGENLRKINPKVPYSEATSVAQNLFNSIQNRGPVTIGTNAQVDDTYNDGYKKLNGDIPADQVDDTSNDGYKKLDGEILANHEDRFTQLPNELLSCILTHMTLRDVVRITTLSKQWKNIWSLLSNLDLNWQVISGYNGCCREDGCEFYRQAYVERVNKVLLECGNHEISSFRLSFCFTKEYASHVVYWIRFASKKRLESLTNHEISSFRLSFCFTKEYASHVDYWIRFASKKRLESLTLQFVCAGHNDSLCEIMTRKHLKPRVLYTITCSFLSQLPCLKNLRLDACNLKLHFDFRFNKLVRLDLYYVFLEGNQLQWLLSNSSTIEWLRIRRCNLPEKLCIGDNLQRLSSPVIHHIYSRLELELNAKSLKFFDFRGMGGVKISFLSAAKLESCNVVIMDSNYEGIKRIFRQYATSIPSLETLILQGMYSLIHVLPAHPSTLFRRVVRLNLYFDADAEVDMLKNFPRLLNSFPQLQKLYLMVSDSFNRKIYEFPDVCLNTSLKEVELGNFRMDWIPCAIYILKCCVVLDRMLISRHTKKYTWDGEWERSGDCFSQQECAYNRFALQGNALSKCRFDNSVSFALQYWFIQGWQTHRVQLSPDWRMM